MKKALTRTLAFSLAACTLLSTSGCVSKSVEESLRKEIDELEEEIDDLKDKNDDLQEENENLKDENESIHSEMDALYSIYNSYGSASLDIASIEAMRAVRTGDNYAVYDQDFNDRIITARWWDYDGTMDKPGIYSSETKTLAFSIQVDEYANDYIYYAYYYCTDKDFSKHKFNTPLFSNTIPVVEYGNGTAYYDIDYSATFHNGYYVLVVAADSSLTEPYILAYAEIK